MDWIGIVMYAVCGALAVVLAQVMVGFKKERATATVAAAVVLFVGLKAGSKYAVEPAIRVWEAKREVREIPFYKELSIHDPVAYERVNTIIAESVRSGDPEAKIALRISDVILEIFPRYVAKASDDSVLAYSISMTDQLERLDRANADACYAFLFPHKYGEPGLGQKQTDAKEEQTVLTLMTDIVESAINHPQAEPDSAQAEALLQPIISALVNEHGQDVKLLSGTAQNGPDRKKVCEMSAEMFRQITALPKPSASLIVRHLLSASAPAAGK